MCLCVCVCECVFAQVNNKITSRLPGKLHKKKHGKSAERATAKGKQHALLQRVFLCWHTWSCTYSAPPSSLIPLPFAVAHAKGKQANVLRLPWLPNKHATWLQQQQQRLRQLTRHPAASSSPSPSLGCHLQPAGNWQLPPGPPATYNLQQFHALPFTYLPWGPDRVVSAVSTKKS